MECACSRKTRSQSVILMYNHTNCNIFMKNMRLGDLPSCVHYFQHQHTKATTLNITCPKNAWSCELIELNSYNISFTYSARIMLGSSVELWKRERTQIVRVSLKNKSDWGTLWTKKIISPWKQQSSYISNWTGGINRLNL